MSLGLIHRTLWNFFIGVSTFTCVCSANSDINNKTDNIVVVNSETAYQNQKLEELNKALESPTTPKLDNNNITSTNENENNENGTDIEADHEAFVKITNCLYKRPINYGIDVISDAAKKLRNEILAGQLETLLKSIDIFDISPDEKLTYLDEQAKIDPDVVDRNENKVGSNININYVHLDQKEQIFLILNDELKTAPKNDVVYVDPDTLSPNSSVFLLGDVNETLPNHKLQPLLAKLQEELSQPKYLPLLSMLADKALLENENNAEASKTNLRRYMKPHRCNHQAPLAKVYYGPKWLICTGYINMNTPSIYD